MLRLCDVTKKSLNELLLSLSSCRSKIEVLNSHSRSLIRLEFQAKEAMGSVMSDAFFSKTEAQYLAGDLK